jgi:hypothetical protein
MADYNRNRGYNDRGRDTNENRSGYGNRFEETSYRSGYGGFGRYGDRDDERGSYGDRGTYSERDNDRGFFERAGDEVRSWFGDDEAERRRRMDDRRSEMRDRYDYDRGSDYRHNYGSGSWDSDRVRRDLDRDDSGRRESREGYGYNRMNDRDDLRYTGGLGAGYGRNEFYPGTTGYGGPGYGGLNERGDHGSSRNDRYGARGTMGRADLSHDRGGDRGPIERAGDEVRTWFGDDEAERRRRMDASQGNWSNRRDWNDEDRRDSRRRW